MRKLTGLRIGMIGLAAVSVIWPAREPIAEAFREPWADWVYLGLLPLALIVALAGAYIYLSPNSR